MFNLSNIFSKKTPVALSITPYLRFVSVGKEIKIVVDSGEEDLNQRVAQFRLDERQSASINRLFITGFDTIYHRLDKPVVVEASQVITPAGGSITEITSGVTALTAKIEKAVLELDKKDAEPTAKLDDVSVLNANPTESAVARIDDDTDHFIETSLPYELLHDHVANAEYVTTKTELNSRVISSIEDAFDHDEGIILGKIWLELSDGELLVIAAPIYTVIPDTTADSLSFVSVPLAQEYIEEEWRSEFTDALLSMDTDAPAAAAPSSNRRSYSRETTNGGFAGNTAIRAGIAAAIIGVLLLAYAFAGVPSFLKADNSKSGASAGSLYATSLPMAQANAASDYDPYAPSTTGMPSAEQYAQMQTAATKDVLKQMNVDLDATADLGCLSN